MTQYRVRHETTYEYAEAVTLCHNVAHLRPRTGPRQSCERSRVEVEPTPAVMTERPDYFGNPTNYFTVQDPHTRLRLLAEHLVTVTPVELAGSTKTPAWDWLRSRYPLEALEYVHGSRYAPPGETFAEYARASFTPKRPILEATLDLTKRIYTDFEYDPAATTVSTPVGEVARLRRGVCQDFAHFQISCLRSLGLATRYVSGYLSTLPPPGQPRLIGADATHAWVSVYCGKLGWIDFDPTNDQIPGPRHVLLAWGRDYDDVAPLKGVLLGGGFHHVSVSVDVAPVAEPTADPAAD